VSTIEHLTAADHAAVGSLLLEAYADYAERMGPQSWARLSEAMTTARGLYERMGFVVDGDLPANFGLRYWRFRRSLAGG
jgi:hypothetical protein